MNAAMKAIPDKLVTTHLEIPDQAHFRPAFLDEAAQADCQVIELEEVDVDYYRFLYGAVGGAWNWTDRLRESAREEIQRDLECPELTVDLFYVSGAPAGFMEVVREGRDFEIIYFGLARSLYWSRAGQSIFSAPACSGPGTMAQSECGYTPVTWTGRMPCRTI